MKIKEIKCFLKDHVNKKEKVMCDKNEDSIPCGYTRKCDV